MAKIKTKAHVVAVACPGCGNMMTVFYESTRCILTCYIVGCEHKRKKFLAPAIEVELVGIERD